nr:disulfide bond formation protein B [Pantoea sp. 201603H]
MDNSAHKPHGNEVVLLLNTVGLLGISVALTIAFYYQFAKFELPCPLCLLQRVGLIIAGCGFLFNICLNIKSRHYGMVIAGGVVTSLIAARQVFLHILPGDTGYGSPFLGLHFYTWALIASILIIIAVAIILIISDWHFSAITLPVFTMWNKAVSLFFIVLLGANLAATVLECGSGQCADNPVRYLLLEML